MAENPSSKLSPHQKRLLAEKLAISREVAYRRARQQRLINSLGLNEGRATTLDDVAKTFEKTNKDKEVAALFEKILAVNKRLGTSIEVEQFLDRLTFGDSGTRRNTRYFIEPFTRTS